VTRRILVAGPADDPCLALLVHEAERSGYEIVDARANTSCARPFHWSVQDGVALLEGRPLEANAAFLRIDAPTGRNRPSEGPSLAEMLTDWALAHPNVALPNRFQSRIAASRPATLSLARACGLRIQKTDLSNECPSADEAAPVSSNRGEPRNVSELRVYLAGDDTLAFSIEAPAPEGRVERGCLIAPVPVPRPLLDPIHSVGRALGIDYGCATFRSCPRTGELLFFGIDPSPSFERCDRLSGGAICRAILRALLEPPSAGRKTDRPSATVGRDLV